MFTTGPGASTDMTPTFRHMVYNSESTSRVGKEADMPLVRVQTKGQITVPRSMREAMGIETGTELVCVQTGPRVFECRVMPKPMSLRDFIDQFSGPEPAPTPEEIQEIVRDGILAEARAEYGDLLED